MSPLSPLNGNIKKNIAELEDLSERYFLEAEEMIRGEIRKAGDIALNLILIAASLKGSSSFESRITIDIFREAVSKRVGEYIQKEVKISPYPDVAFCIALEPELKLKLSDDTFFEKEGLRFRVKWREVLPSIKSKKRKFADFYIEKGFVYLDEREAIELYLDRLSEKARELVESYSKLDIKHHRIEGLAQALTKLSDTRTERIVGLQGKQAPLKEEHFPPCIKLCISGMGSGARNYAITVLLTAFLSYARIAPSSNTKDARISDFIDDIAVVQNEIIPIIEAAAERCSPPLFEDQSMERQNVYYHLGFGLTSNPTLEDAQKSSWYFVPNCDKIRREAPSLCRPEKLCRNVKNPLTYYIRKRFQEGGKNAP